MYMCVSVIVTELDPCAPPAPVHAAGVGAVAGVHRSCAAVSQTLGLAQTFVGTAAYMAPERIHGQDYSVASDVWHAEPP